MTVKIFCPHFTTGKDTCTLACLSNEIECKDYRCSDYPIPCILTIETARLLDERR